VGSNSGTLYQAAENFLVGAAALLRGRCFLNFCYGSVEGGPPVAAPVPTGFGFQEIPDFMGDSERHSLPTSNPSAAASCCSKASAPTASHGPLDCCAVVKSGKCS
jgi:hypothetical protein